MRAKTQKLKKVLKFRMRPKKIFGSICLQTRLTFCVGGGAGTNFVVAYAQHSRMDGCLMTFSVFEDRNFDRLLSLMHT
jgi:hypothetical protein